MLTAIGRGLAGLLLLLIALPLAGPSIGAHATLAEDAGHCAGPTGIVHAINGQKPRQYAGVYCAIDSDLAAPYTLQPYYQRPTDLPTHHEAGLSVLEHPTYSWQGGRGLLYESSALVGTATVAIAQVLYLLLLLTAFVVILRPR